MKRFAMAAVLCALASVALADEAAVKLKPVGDYVTVTASCTPCHSLDYIGMNSPFLDDKGWTATVTKMIKVMGAKISQEDADKIVAYLAKNYGKQ